MCQPRVTLTEQACATCMEVCKSSCRSGHNLLLQIRNKGRWAIASAVMIASQIVVERDLHRILSTTRTTSLGAMHSSLPGQRSQVAHKYDCHRRQELWLKTPSILGPRSTSMLVQDGLTIVVNSKLIDMQVFFTIMHDHA